MSDDTPAQTLNRGRPPHASSAARRAEILRLKQEESLSGVQIARRLGITPAAVCYHLKKAREAGEL